MLNNLKNHRNYLHSIPELAFNEFETSKYIRNILDQEKVSYFEIGTSTVAYIQGKDLEAIGFRADIDALPMQEESSNPYKSKFIGRMHACGHDGHASILLSFIQEIQKLISTGTTPKKSLVFIFQAGEEGGGGARFIEENQKYKSLNVKEIFAIHLIPQLFVGEIGIRSGYLTLQNINLDITVTGKGCHGAQPNAGIDSILVTCKLIEAYQSIISRNVPPGETAILTIGSFKAGTVRNIIPEKVDLLGTIRLENIDLIPLFQERIEKINKGFEISYDVKIDTTFQPFYPPVKNDVTSCEKASIAAKNLNLNINSTLKLTGSEDFSFLLKDTKGALLLLGIRDEEKGFVNSLHNPKFDFDSDSLAHGVNLFKEILKCSNII